MNDKQFVCPLDDVNKLYHLRTRNTHMHCLDEWTDPLQCLVSYPIADIPNNPIETWFPTTKVNMPMGPYWSRCFRIGGWFDRSIVAPEPIAWGIGLYREAIPTVWGLSAYLGEKPPAKITSEYVEVHGTQIIVITIGGKEEPVSWESTNILNGDVLGELEQVIQRRKEIEFIQDYLDQVKHLTTDRIPYEYHRKRGFYDNVDLAPGELVHRGCHETGMLRHQWHRDQQSVWDSPPETVRELLERVDWLLNQTVVDDNPFYIGQDGKFIPQKKGKFISLC